MSLPAKEEKKDNINIDNNNVNADADIMPNDTPIYSDLYRLTDKDFTEVGCTQEEIDKIKQNNSVLDQLTKRKDLNKEEMDQKRLAQEQLYTTFLNAVERKYTKWEYSPTNLPEWILSTGNVGTINQYLRVFGDNLSVIDKAKLLKRRMVTMKAKLNKAVAERDADSEAPINNDINVISNSENDAYLEGVHQKTFQNTGNGCWSVSTELLLQSRGINNVTQSDVRAFRPAYSAKEIRKKLKKTKSVVNHVEVERMEELQQESFDMMEKDKGNNVMDRGDAFLSLSPKSMLQAIEIAPYSEEIRREGIDRNEYLSRAKNVVKQNILHALKVNKSPVSFIKGGHYITIIGIDENNNVKYKESKKKTVNQKPDDDHTINLNSLLGRLVSANPSYVRMEWAADINLSHDGHTIYGIPNGQLSVADDGTVIYPESMKSLDNYMNGYQNHEGMFIRRKNESDSPDGDKSRENSLRNGGVDMRQDIYLPKTLNIDMFKKLAAKRTPEEELRLKQDSKDFYKVDSNANPAVTQDEADNTYDEMLKQSNRTISDKQKEDKNRLKSDMDMAIAATEARRSSGDFDKYIINLYKNDKIEKISAYEGKKLLSRAIIACKMKDEGASFDVKEITRQAEKLASNTGINEMERNEIRPYLSNDNRLDTMNKLKDVVIGDVYKVEPANRAGYLKEMKLLAENMMPKEGRSNLYKTLYDAVKEAANIDGNSPDADKKIARANIKLVQAVKKYTKGKKSVKSSRDPKDRFDNSIDALSIVATFAPRCKAFDVDPLVNRINEVRGAKKRTDPNRIELLNYGGYRAVKRQNERVMQKAPKAGPGK